MARTTAPATARSPVPVQGYGLPSGCLPAASRVAAKVPAVIVAVIVAVTGSVVLPDAPHRGHPAEGGRSSIPAFPAHGRAGWVRMVPFQGTIRSRSRETR